MRKWLKKFWPAIKWLLTLAILIAVGRRFYRDLRDNPELWDNPIHYGWLAFSGLLYVAGLTCFTLYWVHS